MAQTKAKKKRAIEAKKKITGSWYDPELLDLSYIQTSLDTNYFRGNMSHKEYAKLSIGLDGLYNYYDRMKKSSKGKQ
tara:strand:- start:4361 stop:4591 length:231 start_codon:yes stop_codon:yes gene_type:complete